MARNNDIRVDIDGDASGLQRALNQSQRTLDTFARNTSGTLSSSADSIAGAFGRMSTGIGGVISVAGLAATSVGALVLKANDMVRELNQLSKQSGLSVEQLQRLQKAFRETGFDAEKFGDINQDTLDKLSDAYRNGGGIADDIKSVGLDPKKYTKFLNDTQGGVKAVIQMFYDLRDAGASVADQKFLLESVASDASKLTGVLNESANANEAWLKISKESVDVTDERAKQYAEFDKNLNTLTQTGKTYLFEALNPIVVATNNFVDVMSKKPDSTDFFDAYITKANALHNVLNSLGILNLVDPLTQSMIDGEEERRKNNKVPVLNNTLPLGAATVQLDEKGGYVEPAKEQAEREKKLKEEQRKQEQAAAKAKTLQEKAARERLTAEAALDKAITDMTIDSNARQLAEFDRQQKALVDVINKSATTLGLSKTQLQKLLSDQLASGASKRLDMVNQMIGYQDPNKSLKDTNALLASGGLNSTQKDFLADQQNQRINGDNPFTYNNTDQKLSENSDAMNAELAQNDLLLKGHEDYEKHKAEITAKYNAQAITISNQNAQAQLEIFGSTADSLAQGMVDAFGESSGAAQAAFALSKGISIAQTVLSIQSALAQALATPFPASLANYAQILSLGMNIISTAKGAANGQFHGGVDELPAGYDNKSFVLKAGERVVQPEANKKLTAFLDKHEGGSTSGDITVNAPLIIQGDVAGDDKKFNEMLKKHQNSVAQAVRSSQKRNS
ncbi:cell envelope integrity protein TolA [Enterobacter cloacae]|uniref:cell envelope integrity protein TolA n=1 Tax=Enterobacter cloacae TaxID=550 RepID=UPI00254C5B94|nr:cell envelope integrity protein TolA [Enterobacter cloacae]MDV5631293.1 cell envelope integrity protein TolA [Enterobacter cloacae]MDV5669264.1 cell envelope integrity protein TolA [Enterobacter cloacae]